MTMAQDKRVIDQDGRMHVAGCRISKANVCPYYGREIPDWQALGLQADRVYMMYRTPELLQAAAASFENVPLMLEHVAVTAEDPAQDLIAGTVSNARYEHPYLIADTALWTQEAIDGVEDGDRKELSCAYRYVASMIAGTSPDGVRYDGQMVPPGGANHVALVKKGRAGPDVVVADGVPRMSQKSRIPRFAAALMDALRVIAQPEQLAAMDKAIAEEMPAEDEFPDLSAEDKAAARDAAMKTLGCDKLTAEQERDAYQQAAKDKKGAKDNAAPNAATEGRQPKAASDAEIQLAVDAAIASARTGYVLATDAATQATAAADAARADVHALYAARAAVEDKVGVVALDSAEAVYRFALDHAKVDHKDVAASALPALYAATVKAAAAPVAADAALAAKPPKVTELFSGLSNTRRA
jgi:hypothetical protein